MPIKGAIILPECDITKQETQQQILNILNGQKVDVMLSDMAPSATGVKTLDHQQIVQLAMAVLRFSLGCLAEGGSFLVKLLQGGECKSFEKTVGKCFTDVRFVKPHASRMDSAEVFLLARNFTLRSTKNRTAQ